MGSTGRLLKPDSYGRNSAGDSTDNRQAETTINEAVDILKMREKIISQQLSYLENIKAYVFTSPHVHDNNEWIEKAEKTLVNFDWDNRIVNAGARVLDPKEIESCDEKYFYLIEIYGGYMNFVYAVTSTQHDEPHKGLYDFNLLRRVVETFKRNKGEFSEYDLIDILPRNKSLGDVGADASKVLFECIAHELGHICYGHVHGSGYDFRTPGQNIGQEHDADSFAYGIIHSSPSKNVLWLGLIQFLLVQSAKEMFRSSRDPQTHPLYIDRLKTAISRFPELMKKYGISADWAEKAVKKMHEWLR